MDDIGDQSEQGTEQQQMQRVADKVSEILKARAKARKENRPYRNENYQPVELPGRLATLSMPVIYSGPVISLEHPMSLPDTTAFRKTLAAVWEALMALPISPMWSTIIETLPAEP